MKKTSKKFLVPKMSVFTSPDSNTNVRLPWPIERTGKILGRLGWYLGCRSRSAVIVSCYTHCLSVCVVAICCTFAARHTAGAVSWNIQTLGDVHACLSCPYTIALGHICTGAALLKMERSFLCVFKICPRLHEQPQCCSMHAMQIVGSLTL